MVWRPSRAGVAGIDDYVAAERFAAYHEAGHAVIGYRLGRHLEAITIEKGDGTLGQCHFEREPEWFPDPGYTLRNRELAEREVMIAYAGQVAADKWGGVTPKKSADAASDDRDRAAAMAAHCVAAGPDRDALLAVLRDRVTGLVHEPINWTSIARLAAELAFWRTRTGDQVRQIIAPASMPGE